MLTGLTGIIPGLLVAGVSLKVVENVFPQPTRPQRRRRRRDKTMYDFGDFSNVDFRGGKVL